MNKAILLVTLLISSFLINAQNLQLEYPTMSGEGPLVTYEASFFSNIYNNSNDTLDLQWVRVENDLPQGWVSKVCDDGLCYDETVSSANYIDRLAPGASTYIIGYIFVDGITPGNGEVTIVVFDINDSINKNATFNIQYTTWPTGVEPADKNMINIYPVPAKDVLNIQLTNEVASAEIFDITGRSVSLNNFSHIEKGMIDISGLSNGSYFIRFKDREGSVIENRTFVKQ